MSAQTKQTITGTIVRMSNPSTIRITTKVTKLHPIYRKRYTLNREYTAHNPGLTLALGDMVTISPCRPISKTKRWIVAE